jgi:hypothetical protein
MKINITGWSCCSISFTEHLKYPRAYISASKALSEAKLVTGDDNDFNYYFTILDDHNGQIIHFHNIDSKKSNFSKNVVLCDAFQKFNFTY